MTPSDSTTVLGVMNQFGYRMVVPHLTLLARHLSNLDGRGTDWTAAYIRAIAKGQLPASKRMRDALQRVDRYPPPNPEANVYSIPTLTCACGRTFIPNKPERTFCYSCHPVRYKQAVLP